MYFTNVITLVNASLLWYNYFAPLFRYNNLLFLGFQLKYFLWLEIIYFVLFHHSIFLALEKINAERIYFRNIFFFQSHFGEQFPTIYNRFLFLHSGTRIYCRFWLKCYRLLIRNCFIFASGDIFISKPEFKLHEIVDKLGQIVATINGPMALADWTSLFSVTLFPTTAIERFQFVYALEVGTSDYFPR